MGQHTRTLNVLGKEGGGCTAWVARARARGATRSSHRRPSAWSLSCSHLCFMFLRSALWRTCVHCSAQALRLHGSEGLLETACNIRKHSSKGPRTYFPSKSVSGAIWTCARERVCNTCKTRDYLAKQLSMLGFQMTSESASVLRVIVPTHTATASRNRSWTLSSHLLKVCVCVCVRV